MNQVSSQSIIEEEVVEQLKNKKSLLAQLQQTKLEGEGSGDKIRALEDEIDQLKVFHLKINENRAIDTGSYKYPKRDK